MVTYHKLFSWSNPLVLSATNPSYVCKLNMALYDLKQSPRARYTKLNTYLFAVWFQGSKSDTSMFFSNKGSSIIILLIYVDDIIITSSHSVLVNSLIDQLRNQFALKDLGLFRIHLCNTALWGLYRIILSPDLTSIFLSTRSANSCILRPQLIGKLLRGFFVISRAQFLMAFLFNHLLISFLLSCTKQKVVSHSSVESEYKGLANAASELIWIETFLTKLHIPFFTPLVLFCDNLNATHLAAHPILHARTKHIEIDYHFIRDRVLHKSLLVKFTPSKEQLADVLTKSLSAPRFQSLRNKLTVFHSPLNLRRDVKQCN
ncbi:hypothetical protein AAG906_004482 [Vitis piasezkii]